MEKSIELIVRGVFECEGDVLLVRKKGASYAFLPGGHIRLGENAVQALRREIEEETGYRPKVTGYLGSVEHAWERAGGTEQELNLVFRMVLEGVGRDKPPVSREVHLEFLWQPLDKLEEVNLQPYPLRRLLSVWTKGDGEGGWGSSME